MIILIENALGSHRTWICIKVLGDNPIFLITKKKSDKYFQLNSNIMQQQLLSAGKVQIFWEGPKTLKILLWRYYLIFFLKRDFLQIFVAFSKFLNFTHKTQPSKLFLPQKITLMYAHLGKIWWAKNSYHSRLTLRHDQV